MSGQPRHRAGKVGHLLVAQDHKAGRYGLCLMLRNRGEQRTTQAMCTRWSGIDFWVRVLCICRELERNNQLAGD